MKRLVTQFDDQRTRAAVATPTCCCCCCCVASIVTSTAVTVLNAHDLVDQAQMPPSTGWLYRMAALLALPLAVLVATAAGLLFAVVDKPAADWVGIVAFFVAWPALLTLLYRGLGRRRSAKVVAITVVFGTALFFAELYGGALFLLSADDGTGEGDELAYLVAYLVVALTLSFGLVRLLRRWMSM